MSATRPRAFLRFGPNPEDELVYGEDLAWGDAASRASARFAVISDVAVTNAQGATGALSRSRESLARLVLRINGRVRGGVAVVCMWVGVSIRRVSRRFVPGQRL